MIIEQDYHAQSTSTYEKRTYEKPTIRKVEKMTFPLDILEKYSGEVVCKQCSGCHGCR